MAWYETLGKVAGAAAKGYTSNSVGSSPGKIAGSLLDRKKKKRKISDTPAVEPEREPDDELDWEDDVY